MSAFAAFLAGVASAEAVPITSVSPAELLADFNVIVQNVSNANEIGGPVLVGGNLGPGSGPLNVDNVSLGTTTGTTAITGYGEVNIFGNQTSPFNNASGHVFVGGINTITGSNPTLTQFPSAAAVTSPYAFPPGTTVANNPATFQTYIWAPLTNLSNNLAALTATYTVTSTTLDGIPNANGVAVLGVSLATLNGLSGPLNFTGCLALATPCDAVIDVIGAGTLTQGFQFPTSSLANGLPNIIVNFENDVIADVSNVWTASILDPLGSVSATTDVTGNVVAMNYTSTAETHLPGFDCSDNLCTPTVMPEPGSFAILGAALASLGLLRRRRN